MGYWVWEESFNVWLGVVVPKSRFLRNKNPTKSVSLVGKNENIALD
ncbi:hypothetical protein [Tolypothrix sp. FACHB-123]|nr:hypothetical protein [Tolypothrix sp. FACHB-123]